MFFKKNYCCCCCSVLMFLNAILNTFNGVTLLLCVCVVRVESPLMEFKANEKYDIF